MAKALETTPSSEWTVPNQAALELVVDARIAKLASQESPKSTRTQTSNTKPAVDVKTEVTTEAPKS